MYELVFKYVCKTGTLPPSKALFTRPYMHKIQLFPLEETGYLAFCIFLPVCFGYISSQRSSCFGLRFAYGVV